VDLNKYFFQQFLYYFFTTGYQRQQPKTEAKLTVHTIVLCFSLFLGPLFLCWEHFCLIRYVFFSRSICVSTYYSLFALYLSFVLGTKERRVLQHTMPSQRLSVWTGGQRLAKIASAEISQTAITECVAAAKKEKQKIKREKIQKFGIWKGGEHPKTPRGMTMKAKTRAQTI